MEERREKRKGSKGGEERRGKVGERGGEEKRGEEREEERKGANSK